VDAEYDAGNPASGQLAANFPETGAEGAAKRHADRPRELHILDVLTDELSIFDIELLEPLANRLSARAKRIEVRR
jgi:hypothetical protein